MNNFNDFDSSIISDISIGNFLGGDPNSNENVFFNKKTIKFIVLCAILIVLYLVFSNFNINYFDNSDKSDKSDKSKSFVQIYDIENGTFVIKIYNYVSEKFFKFAFKNAFDEQPSQYPDERSL